MEGKTIRSSSLEVSKIFSVTIQVINHPVYLLPWLYRTILINIPVADQDTLHQMREEDHLLAVHHQLLLIHQLVPSSALAL